MAAVRLACEDVQAQADYQSAILAKIRSDLDRCSAELKGTEPAVAELRAQGTYLKQVLNRTQLDLQGCQQTVKQCLYTSSDDYTLWIVVAILVILGIIYLMRLGCHFWYGDRAIFLLDRLALWLLTALWRVTLLPLLVRWVVHRRRGADAVAALLRRRGEYPATEVRRFLLQ